jgi:hypothetical protein
VLPGRGRGVDLVRTKRARGAHRAAAGTDVNGGWGWVGVWATTMRPPARVDVTCDSAGAFGATLTWEPDNVTLKTAQQSRVTLSSMVGGSVTPIRSIPLGGTFSAPRAIRSRLRHPSRNPSPAAVAAPPRPAAPSRLAPASLGPSAKRARGAHRAAAGTDVNGGWGWVGVWATTMRPPARVDVTCDSAGAFGATLTWEPDNVTLKTAQKSRVTFSSMVGGSVTPIRSIPFGGTFSAPRAIRSRLRASKPQPIPSRRCRAATPRRPAARRARPPAAPGRPPRPAAQTPHRAPTPQPPNPYDAALSLMSLS